MPLDWYFDFVSPYAYLQFQRLPELPASVEVALRPVVLGAMLTHWGQLGPAEIPPKRDATYRHVQWLAHRAGLPLRMPAAHPFVSLPLLRLSLALDSTRAVVARLFEFVWVDGHIPQQAAPWAALCAEFGVDPASDFASVKDLLRAYTGQAIARGVYGVPTAVVDGERFFGLDTTDLLLEFVRDPASYRASPWGRAQEVPIAAARGKAPAGRNA